ncbi:hypothetical protein C5688_18890 [Methylocystis sp. MitZ-2018]|nr:hypothetical protein C5688_18890 [Methylocystis sp. MitZ-2018]
MSISDAALRRLPPIASLSSLRIAERLCGRPCSRQFSLSKTLPSPGDHRCLFDGLIWPKSGYASIV